MKPDPSNKRPTINSMPRVVVVRPALLVLENGRAFRGRGFGAEGETVGEVVFNTAMTGYQEILTDPSYAGQIVVMTAPEIGNTGVNRDDLEAERPVCAGLAVRESSLRASNWRAERRLDRFMEDHGLIGIEGIDTRALTRTLRDDGAMRGAISTSTLDVGDLLERVRAAPSMEGLDLVPRVSCAEPYLWEEPSWRPPDVPAAATPPADLHVVAYDFGVKRHILRLLRDAGCRVTVVPATTPAREALAIGGDGYFLSNGPGDPAAVTYGIEATRELVASGAPVFGICLGHQILGLALGAKTFKLPFGHHGGNHPVKDIATGKVEITSQNHGFAVAADSLPPGAEATHINLYDGTIEGIRLVDRPVFGIQYHPEASPGPHDAAYLFGRFVSAMRNARR
ncbi:MAG TPA: glutamine-hydrolyzing carbamoyl-phosphate synthase small subunit [Kofleriaceae bacterium]|nr:glutamine-hydrolyzing carbamoyl-phosphate synthase small subunit [Kofleriaceae bacterium]